MPGHERGSIPETFVLYLEGVNCGRVVSVTGGNATADVISEPPGLDHIVKKHLAGVTYEDIQVNCGIGISGHASTWLAATLNGASRRKSGSIFAVNYDGLVLRTLEFTNALITEVDIPAMDAYSKDLVAFMTVKLTPELTRFSQGGGKVPLLAEDEGAKVWLPRNFKLGIDGLDCTKVIHIDPFPITWTFASANVGEQRDFEKEPLQLHVPNLKVTTLSSGGHAQSWYNWYEDFVVKGNNGADKLKNGTLTFLTEDLKTILAEIAFFNLGIFRLAQSLSEEVVTAEMFCERVELRLAPGLRM
ncbi:MAG: phage tail protein [Ktedonobacteraceae bacterium]